MSDGTEDIDKGAPRGPKPGYTTERGLTGLSYTRPGYIDEEFLPALKDYAAMVKVLKEMSTNDPVIGAILFAFDMLIRQVEWTVVPNPLADDAQEDDVRFLRECMEDMSHTWQDFISEVLSMLVYGWSGFEIVYKRRNGPQKEGAAEPSSNYDDAKIGWRKFAIRSQDSLDRWEIDDDGSVRAMVQSAPPDYQSVSIPIQKMLLFRTSTTKGNPQGRALDPATLIPTPDGWRTMGDLRTGDKVFDEQGRIRYVTATADWTDRPRYRMTFSDGTVIVADAEHQWVTTKVWERAQGKDAKIRTTTEIAGSVKDANGVSNHGVAWAGPLDYPVQHLLVDPYVLGLWLGDGTTLSANIAAHSDDVAEEAALIESAGYATKITIQSENGSLIKVYGGLQRSLRELGVLGDKHVPAHYLRSSVTDRRALLAGLMDSDGTVDKDGRCEFTNTNIGLVDAVAELVRSLGMSAKVNLRKRANGVDHMQDSYCVKFTPDAPVFRLTRKIARCKDVRARRHHYITSVERIEDGPTKCIEVDGPSHLFLAGTGMIPTHNSVLRNAYRPWYFKTAIERSEAIGVERDLAGLPVVKVPSEMLLESATNEEKAAVAAMRQIATNIRRDAEEGVVWPMAYDEMGHPLYELTLLSSGGTRTFDTGNIIERYDRRITMSVLADFLFLGQGANGSFALSSDKTQLFSVAIGAWLGMAEGVLNQWGVKRLFELNGMDTKNPPLIRHGDVEKVDLTVLSTYVATLAGTGMSLFPDPDLEAYLREQANLPEPSPETKEAFEEAAAEAKAQQAAMMGMPPAGGEAPAEEEAPPELDPEAEQWAALLSGG